MPVGGPTTAPTAGGGRAPALAPRAARPLRHPRPPPATVPRAGRSPRSTVSEGAEKRAAQAKPPSAVASAAQQRPASPRDGERAPPPTEQPQRAPRPGAGSPWWRERQRAKRRAAGMTPLEEYMRDTPGLDRLVDLPLVFGDMVMLVATEAASERVPLGEMPYLAAVAALSWVLAGAALGDYKAEPDPDANPLSNMMGWPVVMSIANACVTWATSMVPSMLGFSLLVSNLVVTPEVVLELERDGQLSPQLEVSVALLITMICWRGLAARLRLRAD